MKLIKYPKRESWAALSKRPSFDSSDIEPVVRTIIDSVRSRGDDAVRELSLRLDNVALTDFAVIDAEVTAAERRVPQELKKAIELAKSNIERFHRSQIEPVQKIETMPGVVCWRKSIPIEKVGLYVPAGTAPLFSTVLMLGIPAQIAGCREIILCSPPNKDGYVDDAILYTARVCGITNIFKIGGAQAIAAMAYGTGSVPRVDKIFGPGNQYVTAAKRIVSTEVAIDMPAGPSELAVMADESCNPVFVAADLLSQAEHGPDSQVILVSTSENVISNIANEIALQLRALPRREVAESALANSKAILMNNLSECIDFLDQYASEHLILAVDAAETVAESIINAGSVFIGNYSCESSGDYASGTNHTLPTGGFARSHSGLSLDSFVKKITFQKLSREGLNAIGPAIETMALAEGLYAHKNAVSVRLEGNDAI